MASNDLDSDYCHGANDLKTQNDRNFEASEKIKN